MRKQELRLRAVGVRVLVAVVVGLSAAIAVGLTIHRYSSLSEVVIDSLKIPQGLTLTESGDLLLTEIQAGRLLRLNPGAEPAVILRGLPYSEGASYPSGIAAAILEDGMYYYLVGEHRAEGYSALYRFMLGRTPQIVAGGVNDDGLPRTAISNPYDLVAAPFGGILISDGGSNRVLLVTPRGHVYEYAIFQSRTVPLDSRAEGLPRTMDVVPTGLAYGPDSALYVASFTGFPYPNGEAHVYRMEDQNGDGDALDEGETTVYATGFSTATSLAFQDDGALLVTEYTTDMGRLIRDEGGITHASRLPGRLVRWRDGTIEILADNMVSPTSVVVRGGKALVVEQFAGRVTTVALDGAAGRLVWSWATVTGLVVTVVVLVLLTRRR